MFGRLRIPAMSHSWVLTTLLVSHSLEVLGAQNCLAIVHHTYKMLKMLVNIPCSIFQSSVKYSIFQMCAGLGENTQCLCVCHLTLTSVSCEYVVATYTDSHLQPGWFWSLHAQLAPNT